ncbi:hypothetical protein SC660_00470 [Actinotignum timonense]|uniref:hypothetical protein n=1 Tax=Actinotignum timonense TaxID=1870995 RepID=UPI002A81D228|nr:hypothetical protein [Actinotignum timonense]MDY5133984.1 hypothetical protein [Actinotignum timonense]MDY5144177.1 hypothetical protein [Actinotignum timonense]MDY5149271.1 hypothetical protein [Actinotignum timonense]
MTEHTTTPGGATPERDYAEAVAAHTRADRERATARPVDAQVASAEQYSAEDAKPGWRSTFLGADTPGRATNMSWGSVFAGVAVAIATLVVFSFLGAAIGLGTFDPASSNPGEGFGFGMGLWAVCSIVIALGLGGYVTGALAVKGGLLHGLTTWATTIIVATVAVWLGISAALGAVGSAIGSVGNAAGSAVGGVAQASGNAVSEAASAISDNLDVQWDSVEAQTEKILADTGEETLQPDYLRGQVDGATDDISAAAKDLVVNPENYETILSDLGDSLQQRVDSVTKDIDRDAVAKSVAANTDLNEDEARKAVDNAVEAYNQAQVKAEQALNNAEKTLQDVQAQAKDLVAEGREVAQDVTDTGSTVAIWAFVGLLLSAILTAFAGVWGSRAVVGRNDAGAVRRDADATRRK